MSKKHFSCKNCQKLSDVTFQNGVHFCSGRVKKILVPGDTYRLCIGKGKNTHYFDLMLEEVVSLIQVLSTNLLVQITNPEKKEMK